MIHRMIDDFTMSSFVAAWPISRDFTAKLYSVRTDIVSPIILFYDRCKKTRSTARLAWCESTFYQVSNGDTKPFFRQRIT